MNQYEFYPKPKFTITDFGDMCKPEQKVVITGSIDVSLYKDIADLDAAKDAWWEFYQWIQEESKKQRQLNKS